MNNKLNTDEFGIFLLWAGIITSLISYFAKSSFLYTLGFVFFAYEIFRAFSKNIEKRRLENNYFKDKFLNPVKKSVGGFKGDIKTKRNDKDHKYITCPICGQKLRIPKKKGKIKVKCPKCGSKFDARS